MHVALGLLLASTIFHRFHLLVHRELGHFLILWSIHTNYTHSSSLFAGDAMRNSDFREFLKTLKKPAAQDVNEKCKL